MGAHDRCEDRTVEQTALGRSGIEVSRLILGCGNFGGIGSSPAFFGQGESEEQAVAVMDAAWAAGITTFDTADAYGGGRSETFIGNWIRSRGVRPVLTTKTFNPMEEGADRGLSRERIRRQLETSLERLGVERIDLYLSHAMDPATPVEETAAAFDELRREGTIGAWGGSNVDAAWVEAARPAWVQNSYSLLDRADEGSVIPLCVREGIGYSPVQPAGGRLAHRQVPPRRRAARGLADDAPARDPTSTCETRRRSARSSRSRPSRACARRRPPRSPSPGSWRSRT